MRKKFFIFLGIIFILVVLLFSCHSTSNDKKTYSLINEYQKQIKEKDAEILRLKANNNSSQDLEEVSTLEDENSRLERENLNLKSQNSKLEKENSELKKQIPLEGISSSFSSSKNYLRIKFWEDGKNYKITNEDMYFYKDSYLSKKVKNVTVVSPTISEDYLENGQTVYTVMTNKGLVFMSSYPSLTEVEGNLTAPESAFSEKETKKYLAIKFWKGEYEKKLYEDSNQSWYGDCSLQNKIDNSESILISSENNDCFVMSNGIQVYTAMAEDKSILWMHDSPSLETINE